MEARLRAIEDNLRRMELEMAKPAPKLPIMVPLMTGAPAQAEEQAGAAVSQTDAVATPWTEFAAVEDGSKEAAAAGPAGDTGADAADKPKEEEEGPAPKASEELVLDAGEAVGMQTSPRLEYDKEMQAPVLSDPADKAKAEAPAVVDPEPAAAPTPHWSDTAEPSSTAPEPPVPVATPSEVPAPEPPVPVATASEVPEPVAAVSEAACTIETEAEPTTEEAGDPQEQPMTAASSAEAAKAGATDAVENASPMADTSMDSEPGPSAMAAVADDPMQEMDGTPAENEDGTEGNEEAVANSPTVAVPAAAAPVPAAPVPPTRETDEPSVPPARAQTVGAAPSSPSMAMDDVIKRATSERLASPPTSPSGQLTAYSQQQVRQRKEMLKQKDEEHRKVLAERDRAEFIKRAAEGEAGAGYVSGVIAEMRRKKAEALAKKKEREEKAAIKKAKEEAKARRAAERAELKAAEAAAKGEVQQTAAEKDEAWKKAAEEVAKLKKAEDDAKAAAAKQDSERDAKLKARREEDRKRKADAARLDAIHRKKLIAQDRAEFIRRAAEGSAGTGGIEDQIQEMKDKKARVAAAVAERKEKARLKAEAEARKAERDAKKKAAREAKAAE
eukprot:gene20318-24332_t